MADVYVILVSVIDHEGRGVVEVERMIETSRLSPKVAWLQNQAVDWSDDHPLNRHETAGETLAKMFPSVTNLV
jgi:hypothetical protein